MADIRYKDIIEEIDKIENTQIWDLFGKLKNELIDRGLVRTGNIVGERGEFIAEEYYSKNPALPNLQKAPEGTQNIDAISRKGERYSIKTITHPSKTTGVFYGFEKDKNPDEKKFEYVLIVILDKSLNPIHIYELNWDNFLIHKRWHSRMKAYNLSVTKALIKDATIIL